MYFCAAILCRFILPQTTHPEVRQLALQWQEQVQKFIPESNPEFMKQAEEFHANNPGNELQQGVDEPLYHYITQALQEQ